MVFSSVPLYLDPPNWQQQPNQLQQIIQGHNEHNQHLLITPPPQQQQPGIGGGIGTGPVAQQNRANSMSERARLAKITPPEVPQKCPRCDSTNTKFCYYNNYSLSQPRHFCKTCRRYWTRGGALRNVPVGGGCRRNKRSSSSSNNKASSVGNGATSSKSTLSSSSQSTLLTGDHTHLGNDSRDINVNSLTGVGNSMSFMASLHNIAQLGGMSNMGLPNFNSQNTPLGLGGGGYQHNNLDQFPQQQVQFPNFLGGFEIPGASAAAGSGLFSNSFQNVIRNNNMIRGENEDDQERLRQHMNGNDIMGKSSSIVSQVKMEENGQQGLNLAKQLMMGISSSNDNNNISENSNNQFWGGNNNLTNNSNSNNNNATGVTSIWTDLSGLNSSSTNHLL